MKEKSLQEIESKRLFYRAFEMNDAKQICALLQEKEIIDNTLSIPFPYDQGMAEEWISTHKERYEHGEYKYAVVLKEDNSLIGTIELIIENEFQRAVVGYWLGKPYWKNGYATEMLARIIQFGFEKLNLNRIYGEYFDHNLASSRVMEKNDMIYEGRLREHKIKSGKFLSTNIRGILKSEWSAN